MPDSGSQAANATAELDPHSAPEQERAPEAASAQEPSIAPEGGGPGAWKLPVAVVTLTLVAAALALALAYRELADESREASLSAEPTQAPSSPPTRTAPTDVGSRAPSETGSGEPALQGNPGTRVDVPRWPQGRSAYTVILKSARSRSEAESKARSAKAAGIPAGILRSDEHSNLRPGYWVTFGGEHASSDEAEAEVERYASLGHGGGYVRFVAESRGSGR